MCVGFTLCITSRTLHVDLHAKVAVDTNTGLPDTKVANNIIKSNAHFFITDLERYRFDIVTTSPLCSYLCVKVIGNKDVCDDD